jgi:hypothetical protein
MTLHLKYLPEPDTPRMRGASQAATVRGSSANTFRKRAALGADLTADNAMYDHKHEECCHLVWNGFVSHMQQGRKMDRHTSIVHLALAGHTRMTGWLLTA